MINLVNVVVKHFGCVVRVEEGNDGVLDWDNLGFGLVQTDYMYSMRCAGDGVAAGGQFSDGKLGRYGNIELSPASGVLNYGQVLILILSAKILG